MLELTVAICILFSLILYALMGGADFGGGMWDLLAAGPRAPRQRHAIAAAIGPIWEANHVWLILVVVLLFTGFPGAFAAMMTALNLPITVMVFGIVLRGSAFIFRQYDSKSSAGQHRWGKVFGAACFITPFFQGVTIGALATGQMSRSRKCMHLKLRCACWSWRWVSAPSSCCRHWLSCSTFSRARRAGDEGMNHETKQSKYGLGCSVGWTKMRECRISRG